jgi:RNA polymerase sigma factor (sigma-70 family)
MASLAVSQPALDTSSSQPPWAAGGSHAACSLRTRERCDGQPEPSLVLAAKRGGSAEREELIQVCRPLIASIAGRYRRASAIEHAELTQEGVVGLLRALERFDPDRGVPFWAYARWWVRQAMQHVVSELSRPIVLSDRALRQLTRIKEAQRHLEQRHARAASISEVAAATGLSRAQVERLLSAERRPRPLDEPASESSGDTATVGDLLADPPAEEAYDDASQRVVAAEVPRLLGCLTERERTVICLRYGIRRRQHTLSEVAERLAVTAERVRQIEQASLEKLHSVVVRT